MSKEINVVQDNDAIIYEVLISPIKNESNEHSGKLLLFRDITVRKQAMLAYYGQLQHIAVLEERQRVARELHDSVNQTLFAASTLADLLPKAVEKKPAKVLEYAFNIQQLLVGATSEMRLILLELYPDALAETDIYTIFKHLCHAVTGSTGIEVDFTMSGQIELDKEAHLAFYRIADEALNNIKHHANATQIIVKLAKIDDTIELLIQDNGLGFDVNKTSTGRFGLRNMRDRAHNIGMRLTIVSEIDRGTTIRLIGECL